MKAFKKDSRITSLLPKQSASERALLIALIERDGPLDGSVVVADIPGLGRILLDGHNTPDVCQLLRTRPPKPRSVKMASIDDAIQWVVDFQLSRRNLTPMQRSYFIGKKYLAERKPNGGGRPAKGEGEGHTRDRIASEMRASTTTVGRDATFAEALDEMPSEERESILNGDSRATKTDVIEKHRQAKGKPKKVRKPDTILSVRATNDGLCEMVLNAMPFAVTPSMGESFGLRVVEICRRLLAEQNGAREP